MSIKNIKPCYWGKKYWGTIYSMLATYPENPDREYINSIKMYFLSLRKLLCCKSCGDSYTIFSSHIDTDINNSIHFATRTNAINFVFRLRDKVNKKVGLEYNLTPEYFKYKLDKMLCVDNNPTDGHANDMSEAPFLQESMKQYILNYVHKNRSHINNYDSNYTKKLIHKLNKFIKKPNFSLEDKNFKLWLKRNNQCRSIITQIYNNMSCGDYNMLDSFYRDKELHLRLFYMGCSIMPIPELEYIFKNN